MKITADLRKDARPGCGASPRLSLVGGAIVPSHKRRVPRHLGGAINLGLMREDAAARATRSNDELDEATWSIVSTSTSRTRPIAAPVPKTLAPVRVKLRHSREHRRRAIFSAALNYAKRGFRIFPVHGIDRKGRCTCGRECGKGSKGKHPCITGWRDVGPVDAPMIREWQRRWPDMNIGVATGSAAGAVVLDVDKHEIDGEAILQKLMKGGKKLPRTPTSRTGSGGRHLFFRTPAEPLKSCNGLLPGIDFKAEGGYVILPPSLHRCRRRYRWIWSPDDAPLAALPAWIEQLARMDAPIHKVVGAYLEEHGTIPEGTRNVQLTSIAGKLWNLKGIRSAERLQSALELVNQVLCIEPLELGEIERIAASIARRAKHEAAAPLDCSLTGFRMQPLDLSRSDGRGVPELPWLLPGWLAEGDIALLCGGAETGKSTLLAGLANAFVRGHECCGLQPTRPIRVLVLDEEQSGPLTTRLYQRTGLAFGEDPAHPWLRVYSSQGLDLNTAEGRKELDRVIAEHGAELVIMDSISTLFPGVNEDRAYEVTPVFVDLRRLRMMHSCTFVLVHHAAKTRRPGSRAVDALRGSTAYAAQADTVWLAELRHGVLELRQAKRRGAEKLSLRIREEKDDPDGAIRLVGLGAAAGEAWEKGDQVDDAAKLIMVHLVSGPKTRDQMIKQFSKPPHSVKSGALDKALKRLLDEGKIRKVRRGTYERVA